MKVILFASLCSFPLLAATESPKFFIGAKAGYQWAQDDNFHHSAPDASLFGVQGGWQLSPKWRWDIGYQYHSELKANETSVDVSTWLIESALRYNWHLQDNLNLYGRVGAAYWDVKKNQLVDSQRTASGFSPLGEIGMSYQFTPNVELSVGYQYIHGIGRSNTGQYDSHAALVGMSYAFGNSAQFTAVEPTPDLMPRPIPVKKDNAVIAPVETKHFPTDTKSSVFGFDSTKPSADFMNHLPRTASILIRYPQAQAIIVGHTDATGPAAYNQTLSERRAATVANELIKLNVPVKQLQWRGEGESQPVADNNTAEGRTQNRRVDVTIPRFEFEE